MRAVIGRRLAPLSADAVQVLSAAAVVGREFDLALVGPACEPRSLVEQLPQRPRNGVWLPAAALACVLCAHMDEPEAADSLYPVLSPYAGHVVAFTAPQPVVYLGSASFYLALLATLTTRWAAAADHFEAAIAAHDRLGARPLLARTRYRYARMLLRRGQAADRSRAHRLLDQALATANALGMAAVAEAMPALQPAPVGGMVSAERTTRAAAPELPRNLFRREGEYWTVCYEGAVVRLKDAKGLRHLARLLAHPGSEFHATDLETAEGRAGPAPSLEPRGGPRLASWTFARIWGMRGAAGRHRQGLLQDPTRGNARRTGGGGRQQHPVRAAKTRHEMDLLVGKLARAVRLGGRDRKAASHAERARLNAARAIRAAIANLARANPSLGRHLTATIRTGRCCSYTPDPRAAIGWER